MYSGIPSPNCRRSDQWAATLPASRYGFAGPEALAAGKGALWVANAQANSVIEINARTGQLMRTLSGSAYGFDDPIRVISGRRYGLDDPGALTVGGGRVWIADQANDSITGMTSGPAPC
jgi:hypothetical protein